MHSHNRDGDYAYHVTAILEEAHRIRFGKTTIRSDRTLSEREISKAVLEKIHVSIRYLVRIHEITPKHYYTRL
jgi:hypothetical protein